MLTICFKIQEFSVYFRQLISHKRIMEKASQLIHFTIILKHRNSIEAEKYIYKMYDMAYLF